MLVARSQRPVGGQPRVVGDLERVAVDLVGRREIGQACLGVGDHRAELDDPERPAVEPDPLLAEEDR